MTQLMYVHRFFLIGLYFFFSVIEATPQTGVILTDSNLSPGFDMGVNSSGGRTDWLKKEDGYMKMSYPAGQSWGAVFITTGKSKQPPRPFQDFSAFKILTVEMKGESGGEKIEIGIKTNTQPDDGSETKIQKKLTSEWKAYSFPLQDFTGVDRAKLYVVIEFVFSGENGQIVYFRNIKYQ